MDYDGPWPCYSMYRCRVNTLLHIAQESDDNTTNKIEETILWQRLQHPHNSVYINPRLKTDVVSNLMEISRNEEHESGCLSYSVCCFTLSSVNNELLQLDANILILFLIIFWEFYLKTHMTLIKKEYSLKGRFSINYTWMLHQETMKKPLIVNVIFTTTMRMMTLGTL